MICWAVKRCSSLEWPQRRVIAELFVKQLLHSQVAKRRPNDEDAKIKFTECNKMVKKQAFERAIANDVPDKTLAEIHTEFESIGKWKLQRRPHIFLR